MISKLLVSKVIAILSLTGLLVANLTFPVAGLPSIFAWTKERVTNTPSSDTWLVDAEMGPNGVLHMTWLDSYTGTYEIYYNYRTASGTYGTPFQVSSWSGTSNRNLSPPRIAVGPDGDVIIVWSENRGDANGQSVYYRWKQSDVGWQSVQRYGLPVNNPSMPDVAVNSHDSASVAWYSLAGGGPMTYVYVDGVLVGGDSITSAMLPRIVFDKNDNLHLAYQALYVPINIGEWDGWMVRYRRRSSAGVWGTDQYIAGGGTNLDAVHAFYPDVAVGPNNYGYILYRQEGPPVGSAPSDTNQLYCSIAETAQKINIDGYGTYPPSMVVCPSVKASSTTGNVYMTWCKLYSAGVYSVYYREIASGVLQAVQRPLTETLIEKPIIVLDESTNPETGYLIYEDYHLGGNAGELYLLKSPLPIIPEFPSYFIWPLFMAVTLVAVWVYRRKNSAE
jgi:hypothetical protein